MKINLSHVTRTLVAAAVLVAASRATQVQGGGQNEGQAQGPGQGQSQGRGGRGRGGPVDSAPTGPTPRTPDGHPDLSGNWQPNAIRQNVDMIGTGVEVPMLPEAKAVYDKRRAALGREDPEARCLPPGVPRMST